MKKNRFYTQYIVLPVILLGLFFNSCEDLDEDLSGTLVTSSFYSDEKDLEMAVTGIYNAYATNMEGDAYQSNRFYSPIMGGDDVISHFGSNKAPFRDIDIFAATSNNINLDKVWEALYRGILRCNTLIKYAPKANTTEAKRNECIGQAKFLRALAYFDLIRFWGDVPFPTQPDVSFELAVTPVATIMDTIMSDLKFAEKWLPDQYPPDQYSKANKWSAKTLLADVYLKMAGWPLKETSYYAFAKDKAQEVISSGKYSLMDDFANLWDIKYDNSSNPEYVFVFTCSYTAGNAYANRSSRSTFAPEEDGWNDYFAQIGFFNAFPNDYRKEKTFQTVIKGKPWQETELHHPFFAKWRSGNSLAKDGSGTHKLMTDRSVVMYRYPILLFTYAEAQCMADGTPNAQAYEYVNMIRRRANKLPIDVPNSEIDLTPGLSQIAFRDSVIAERGWEFAGEKIRFHDLVRIEQVAEMNIKHRVIGEDPQDYTKPWDWPVLGKDILTLPKEHYYYLPFSETELANNPLLVQKPGY